MAGSVETDYSPYAGYNPDPCYQSENHDTADLCAQWRAAIAAEKAAITAATANALVLRSNQIAFIGAFLTFVSVVLLIWTLRLTRNQLKIAETDRNEAREEAARLARDTASALAQATRTADAAFKSADAAIEHVAIAQEAARQSLRPYVHIEKILPRKVIEGFDDVKIFVKNFGSTPATDVVFQWGMAYVGNGIDAWPTMRSSISLGRDIAPGHFQKSIVGMEEDWSEEARKVAAGEGEIRIALRVIYSGYGIDREKLDAAIRISARGCHVDARVDYGNVKIG